MKCICYATVCNGRRDSTGSGVVHTDGGDLRSTLLLRRWMERRAAIGTTSPWGSPLASMEVNSSQTLILWVSRNKVVDHTSRNVWSGLSPKIAPSALWNYTYWKQNYVVQRWDAVFIYVYNQRQKKRLLFMKSVLHWAFADMLVFTPMLMTSPRGVAFPLLEGRSIYE